MRIPAKNVALHKEAGQSRVTRKHGPMLTFPCSCLPCLGGAFESKISLWPDDYICIKLIAGIPATPTERWSCFEVFGTGISFPIGKVNSKRCHRVFSLLNGDGPHRTRHGDDSRMPMINREKLVAWLICGYWFCFVRRWPRRYIVVEEPLAEVSQPVIGHSTIHG